MDKTGLRALQAPLKERYRDDPDDRRRHPARDGGLARRGDRCTVATGRALVEAGLHPATGGDGLAACSGRHAAGGARRLRRRDAPRGRDVDGHRRPGGTVRAEGDLDFRGTLGVAKEAPVGFRASGSASSSTPTRPTEQMEKLLAPDRALLRRPPDAHQRRPGRGLAGHLIPIPPRSTPLTAS